MGSNGDRGGFAFPISITLGSVASQAIAERHPALGALA